MGIEQCVIHGRVLDEVETRSMFYANLEFAEGPGALTSQALWLEYLTPIYEALQPILSIATTFYEYQINRQDESGNWIPFDLVSFPLAGSNDADPGPNAVAAVLIGKVQGKRGIGRKFISGISHVLYSANSVTTSTLLALADAALAYISPAGTITTGLLVPGLVRKDHSFAPFIGGWVSHLLGSMRRRKPGLGI